MKNHGLSKEKGFTLIELLVVIAIIALLSSVVFASLKTAREKARMAAALQFDGTVARVLGDRRVAQWTFENGGNPLIDTAGQDHMGTCTSCPVATTSYDGKPGYLFDGTKLIYVGLGNNYFPLSAFTICAWVKSPGLAPGMTLNGIISLSYSITMSISDQGKFETSLEDNASVADYLWSTGNLHDNKFHHLCMCHDGVRRYNYVDGHLDGSDIVTWMGTSSWPTSDAVIGSNINNTPLYMFNGIIDDVTLYAGAITQ